MPQAGQQRLAHIDWLRGFACLGMFQTHCYDSWLGGAARKSWFFHLSQLIGTLPAPLFIFVSGISCALVTDRLRRKGVPENKIAKRTILRGAEILAFGLLFRVQEFALGQPWAPWTDLLRVDVLNVIGLSIIFMGLVCWISNSRMKNAALAAAASLGVAMATPPLWTNWQPKWLPWYLESYINGVHIYKSPQPWLFPIFPWAAFGLAGLAVGMLLFGDWAAAHPAKTLGLCGLGGAGLIELSRWLDAGPWRLYAVYDYWHTSPNFFLARVGILLMLSFAAYAWCRWGIARVRFSPMIQLGQASLLVYWVHIEFVYGRFSILTKQEQTIPMATIGFLIIFAAMVALSVARTRTKGRSAEILTWVRREVQRTVQA